MVKQSVVFQNLATRDDEDMSQYLKGLLAMADVQDIEALYAGGSIEGTPTVKMMRLLQNLVDKPSADDFANLKKTPLFKTALKKVNPDPQKKLTAPALRGQGKPPSTTTTAMSDDDIDVTKTPRGMVQGIKADPTDGEPKSQKQIADELEKQAKLYQEAKLALLKSKQKEEAQAKKVEEARQKMAGSQEMEVDATGKPLVDLDKRKRENTATASSSKKQEMDPVRAELFRYLKEKYPKLNEADIYRYIVEENVSPRGIVDALEKAYMDNVDDDTPIDVEADKAFIDKVVAENPEKMKGATETKQYRDFMKPEKRKVIKENRKKARSAEAVQNLQKKDRAQVVDEKRKGRIENWLAGEIDSEELYDSTVPAEKRGAKFSTKKQGNASERGRAVAMNRRRDARLKKIEELRGKAEVGDIDDAEAKDKMEDLLDEFFEEDSGASAPKPQTVPESDPYFDELRQFAKDNRYSKEQYDDLMLDVQTNSASRANYDVYRSEVNAPKSYKPVYTEPEDTGPLSASTQAEQTPDPVKAGAQPVELAPTKAELIPKERLAVEGKSPPELLADIMYFFKNFAPQLKPIKAKWDKLPRQQKSNEAVLKRYHGEIVGRLQPEGSKAGEGKEGKVGIVVDAEQYIENKMREIMLDARFANMQPAELVDVNEGIKKKQATDMGAFEVRQGLRGGKSFIQREPVYKAISTSQPDQLAVQMRPPGKATQPMRLSLMPAKQINLATTAKSFNSANPFARSVPTITLKVLK